MLNVMHDRSTGLEHRHQAGDRAIARDPRLPDAFVGMLAFGATLAVAVALARAGTGVGWGTQLAVMAVTVALVSWCCRVLPSLLVAVLGWLMLNGIVVNGGGRLGWDGRDDAIRVGVLLGAGLAAALARAFELRLRLPVLPTSELGMQTDRQLYAVQADTEPLGDRDA